ncbi:transcription termination factor Rho [bacterium]|nr:transcription termination factor Rho [bacterium]
MAKKRTRRGGSSTAEDRGGDSRNSNDSARGSDDRSANSENQSNDNSSGGRSSNDNGGGNSNNSNSGGGNSSGGNSGGGPRRRRRRSGGGGGGGGNSNNSNGGGGNSGGGGGGNSRRRRGGSNSGGGGNSGNRNNNNRNNNNNRSRRGNREPVEFDDAELIDGYGMLEMHPNGYGFLRSPENNYSREKSDPFVPGTMIEKYNLRAGLMLTGRVQPARRQQGPRLREVIDVDGKTPEEYLEVATFDSLTPINPEQWYRLETGPEPLTTRVMDLLTPMGKGQRALIVAPPRSGKTIMMQHISQGIAKNHPESKLIVLLVDERPEEVTDMKRNVKGGEVIASSLDEDIESHVRLSQLVIERCKRLAEMGQDVFLLMDSITRLARAFNKWVGNTGRTMSGGVDIKAMDVPKKLFSAARAFEEGGSLTIVGTALIDTGSRMDELIFQEFKGTGNMELVLDRKLADRRVWPAIDINKSGTRREELLLGEETLSAVTMLRRTLTTMPHVEAMEQLTRQLGRFKTNEEFIELIKGKVGEL